MFWAQEWAYIPSRTRIVFPIHPGTVSRPFHAEAILALGVRLKTAHPQAVENRMLGLVM
jgi:hypothetical protein